MNKFSASPRQNARPRAKATTKDGKLAANRRAPSLRGRRPLPDFEADAKRIFGQDSKFGDVLLGDYGHSIL